MDKFLIVLPVLIMIEMFLASIPYAIAGKWGTALYWFAGGLLNCAVIFGIRKFG